MKLTYRDGTQGEDELFDMPRGLQVMHVVHCMNLDPGGNPELWPMQTIDRLLAIRRNEGRMAFDLELMRTLSPR